MMARLGGLKSALSGLGQALVDLALPPLRGCPLCGVEMAPVRGASSGSGRATGEVIALGYCRPCLLHTWLPEPTLCDRCPRPERGEAGLCDDCAGTVRAFYVARAVGAYEGNLREAILRLKYRGERGLARPLGALMALRARELGWGVPPGVAASGGAGVVVPVPLHSRRRRERGFNQAELLAREVARRLSLPMAPAALVRRGETKPQAGLGPTERWDNVAGAIRQGSANGLEGKSVLLIDDIYTTGATAEACVRQLAAAGAARVDVLTLAVGGVR